MPADEDDGAQNLAVGAPSMTKQAQDIAAHIDRLLQNGADVDGDGDEEDSTPADGAQAPEQTAAKEVAEEEQREDKGGGEGDGEEKGEGGEGDWGEEGDELTMSLRTLSTMKRAEALQRDSAEAVVDSGETAGGALATESAARVVPPRERLRAAVHAVRGAVRMRIVRRNGRDEERKQLLSNCKCTCTSTSTSTSTSFFELSSCKHCTSFSQLSAFERKDRPEVSRAWKHRKLTRDASGAARTADDSESESESEGGAAAVPGGVDVSVPEFDATLLFSQWRRVLRAQLEGSDIPAEEAFRRFDTNHDGCLDEAEFQAALEYLNSSIDHDQRVKVTAGLAGAAFMQLDADGNARVDESEFVEWVNNGIYFGEHDSDGADEEGLDALCRIDSYTPEPMPPLREKLMHVMFNAYRDKEKQYLHAANIELLLQELSVELGRSWRAELMGHAAYGLDVETLAQMARSIAAQRLIRCLNQVRQPSPTESQHRQTKNASEKKPQDLTCLSPASQRTLPSEYYVHPSLGPTVRFSAWKEAGRCVARATKLDLPIFPAYYSVL